MRQVQLTLDRPARGQSIAIQFAHRAYLVGPMSHMGLTSPKIREPPGGMKEVLSISRPTPLVKVLTWMPGIFSFTPPEGSSHSPHSTYSSSTAGSHAAKKGVALNFSSASSLHKLAESRTIWLNLCLPRRPPSLTLDRPYNHFMYSLRYQWSVLGIRPNDGIYQNER